MLDRERLFNDWISNGYTPEEFIELEKEGLRLFDILNILIGRVLNKII